LASMWWSTVIGYGAGSKRWKNRALAAMSDGGGFSSVDCAPSLSPMPIAQQELKVLARQLPEGRAFDPPRRWVQSHVLGARRARPIPRRLLFVSALEQADVVELTTAGTRRHGETGSRTVSRALGHGASAHHMGATVACQSSSSSAGGTLLVTVPSALELTSSTQTIGRIVPTRASIWVWPRPMLWRERSQRATYASRRVR